MTKEELHWMLIAYGELLEAGSFDTAFKLAEIAKKYGASR